MPSTGHGEFNPNWHVFLIVPFISALTGGSSADDAAVNAAYASQLTAKSEAEVDALLATTLNGHPIAIEIDTHFYFLCSVVSPNAAR